MNPSSTPSNAGAAGPRIFFVTSLVSLLLAMLMLAGRPAFLLTPVLTGHGLAWLELLLFGCAFSGVFAIAYESIPRAFDLPAINESLILLHWGFHLAGILLSIAGGFGSFRQSQMGPTFLACGAIVFAIAVGGSLRKMVRPDASAAFLSATILWLLVLVCLGVPFTAEPPFPMFGTMGWNAGWIVLALAGVVTNACLGTALRITPRALGLPPANSATAWSAFVFMNAGLAWLFAAAALGPMPFVMLCAGVFGVGALVYLAALVQILQSRPSHQLVWDARILLCSVLMIPVAVGLLVFSAWQRLMIPPPDPAAAGAIASEAADAASGPLPFEFLPADGGTVLTMLLAVLVPAVVAVMFQLVRLQSQGPTNPESFRARLGNQILLASYFNYAVGVLMVIPAAWVGIERILTLGTLFLLVGALGFLGNYFFLARKQPAEKSEAGEPGLEATPAA